MPDVETRRVLTESDQDYRGKGTYGKDLPTWVAERNVGHGKHFIHVYAARSMRIGPVNTRVQPIISFRVNDPTTAALCSFLQ